MEIHSQRLLFLFLMISQKEVAINPDGQLHLSLLAPASGGTDKRNRIWEYGAIDNLIMSAAY